MKKLVFWIGVYDLISGFTLFFPDLHAALGVTAPQSIVLSELVALLLMWLGLALVLCSHNLAERGAIVYWSGVFRLMFFIHLTWFGFMAGYGVMLGVFGLVDLAIGLIILVGLPRAVGRTPGQLLLDKA